MLIDVIIPTFKPDERLITIIKRLREQTVSPNRIVLINTEQRYIENLLRGRSYDSLGKYIEIINVSAREFDHGATRNKGAAGSVADYLLFMTQDALPANDKLLETMAAAFSQPGVAAVYARQLAGKDARIQERFSRDFNYPDKSEKKTLADLDRLGIKTFFCSNVCAAYRRSCFDTFGGFVERAIFNEDMVYAAKLIDNGLAVYYAANAGVIHSHAYSNSMQFRRNFDLAVSQAMHPEVFGRVKSESEGLKFVLRAFGYFTKHGRPLAIVPFLLTSVNKYAGYRKGKNYRNLSREQILRYTMNPGFFERMWKEEDRGKNDR